MVCAVNIEDAMNLHRGCSLGKDFTFNPIGPESDVGVFCALKNFLMHLLVPHAITAMAGGGIKYYFAAHLAGRRVVIHPAPFEVKTSVDSVESVPKGKLDCSLRGNKLKTYLWRLSAASDSRQNQG